MKNVCGTSHHKLLVRLWQQKCIFIAYEFNSSFISYKVLLQVILYSVLLIRQIRREFNLSVYLTLCLAIFFTMWCVVLVNCVALYLEVLLLLCPSHLYP